MNSKAAMALVAGALVVGLLVGLAIGGGDDDKSTASGPGPTKVVNGVPVGYERSKEGAIQAALNYEGAFTAAGVKGYQAVVEAAAVPARRKAIAEAMRPGFDLIADRLGEDAVVRGAVVGYRLKAYDAGAAEVELWEVGVVGSPNRLTPQSGWRTTTLRLRWVADDWKLAEAPEGRDGPTPQQPDTPTNAEEFLAAVRGLEEVRYVSAQ